MATAFKLMILGPQAGDSGRRTPESETDKARTSPRPGRRRGCGPHSPSDRIGRAPPGRRGYVTDASLNAMVSHHGRLELRMQCGVTAAARLIIGPPDTDSAGPPRLTLRTNVPVTVDSD